MCLLRFENNFLTIGHVRFRFENSCLAMERVRFASKIIFFYLLCSLRFESNLLTIEGVRFASISKKTPLSKLSFAFVAITSLTSLKGIQSGGMWCLSMLLSWQFLWHNFHLFRLRKKNYWIIDTPALLALLKESQASELHEKEDKMRQVCRGD